MLFLFKKSSTYGCRVGHDQSDWTCMHTHLKHLKKYIDHRVGHDWANEHTHIEI